MKISKELLKKLNVCDEGLNWFCNKYRKEEPELRTVIDDLMLIDCFEWANWLISHVLCNEDKVKYAVFCAEKVLRIFETKFPDDDRPRKAIRAAKEYHDNKSAAAADTACVTANAADTACAAAAAAAAAAYAAHAFDAGYAADAAVYAACAAARAAAYAADAASRVVYAAASAARAAADTACVAEYTAHAAVYFARAARIAAHTARTAARTLRAAANSVDRNSYSELQKEIIEYGLKLLNVGQIE